VGREYLDAQAANLTSFVTFITLHVLHARKFSVISTAGEKSLVHVTNKLLDKGFLGSASKRQERRFQYTNMPQLEDLRRELKSATDPDKAKLLQRFFKTGEGEYGHGDVFLGITVPRQREIARRYYELPVSDILELLKSKIHEERFTALVLLVHTYQKGDNKVKSKIFTQYLKHAKWINNWDLVDTSTPQIVGNWCFRRKNPDRLLRLAKSKDLWERRIGVLGSFTFIREHDLQPALDIAEMLLNDKHDLIHKAVGWMLREAHKRQAGPVHEFLDRYAHRMPRVMLRYAIEKLPDSERKRYLAQSKPQA